MPRTNEDFIRGWLKRWEDGNYRNLRSRKHTLYSGFAPIARWVYTSNMVRPVLLLWSGKHKQRSVQGHLDLIHRAVKDTRAHPFQVFETDARLDWLKEEEIDALVRRVSMRRSILHWEENVKKAREGRLEYFDIDSRRCALCEVYYPECGLCPLGQAGEVCMDSGSAWLGVRNELLSHGPAQDTDLVAKAQAMLDLLKKLEEEL